MLRYILFAILVLYLSGCASSEEKPRHAYGNPNNRATGSYKNTDVPIVYRIPASRDSENSKAHGAAYVIDAMSVQRPIPMRPSWKPMKFYFKDCQNLGVHKVHTSRHEYDCGSPF